jgi:putative transposase
MKVSSFHVGSHLTLNNENYKIIRKLTDSIVLENLDDLSIVTKKEALLLKLLTNGNLTFFGKRQKVAAVSKNQQSDLKSLSEEHRKTVFLRYQFVKSAITRLGNNPTTVGLTAVIADIAKTLGMSKSPSMHSVYKWWKKFHQSGEDILALTDKKTGKSGVRCFNETVLNELKAIIDEEYLTNTRPTASLVYKLFTHRMEVLNSLRPTPLKFPSKAQFYRIIKKLNQYEKMVNREGKSKADKHFRSTGAGVKVSMILERVEVDHTPIDALIVDDVTGVTLGRPTLTVLIDVYSRMILGFYLGFEPASLVAVTRALRQAIMPKDDCADYLKGVSHEWPAYGIPMTIICDNGSEFHAETFHRLCGELNINIQYCPKLEAHYKGTVERVVGTINNEVCHNLPGSTSSSVNERGDYDPEKFAVVTEKELKTFIAR